MPWETRTKVIDLKILSLWCYERSKNSILCRAKLEGNLAMVCTCLRSCALIDARNQRNKNAQRNHLRRKLVSTETIFFMTITIISLRRKFTTWATIVHQYLSPILIGINWSRDAIGFIAGDTGRDPFNPNFRKFRSKTKWIGSVQMEMFRKSGPPCEVDHFFRLDRSDRNSPFHSTFSTHFQSQYVAVRYFPSVLLVHTCVVTRITWQYRGWNLRNFNNIQGINTRMRFEKNIYLR